MAFVARDWSDPVTESRYLSSALLMSRLTCAYSCTDVNKRARLSGPSTISSELKSTKKTETVSQSRKSAGKQRVRPAAQTQLVPIPTTRTRSAPTPAVNRGNNDSWRILTATARQHKEKALNRSSQPGRPAQTVQVGKSLDCKFCRSFVWAVRNAPMRKSVDSPTANGFGTSCQSFRTPNDTVR